MTTSAPVLEPLWAPLHGCRFEWAYRAYHRFMEALSPEIRAHLAQGDGRHESYVVVFGNTQVGKTTLLLELMDIHLDAQERVSNVLRAGREEGKSATATTMEYRRSPDDNWRLDTGAGARTLVDDAAMRKALEELRQEMSERRLNGNAPVVAWIPDGCFGLKPGTGIGARMLDLPGDNPADEVEREHVKHMAQRYVPYADLILLVGRGDDLAFLNPDALTLPGIKDWQFLPNRFRIVTTYSFTAESVQQLVRTYEGELDPECFRKRLLSQISTFGLALSPEAQQTKRYFPLEFGKSWYDKKKTDSELVRRVDPVLERLKAELHAEIKASATEAARFWNAFDVHVLIRRKREACLNEGEASVAMLDVRIKAACASEQKAETGARLAAVRFDIVQGLLGKRPKEAKLKAELAIDATEHADAVDGLETNTGALFGRINDFTSWLRQQFLETQPTSAAVKEFFGNSRPNLSVHIDKVNRIAEDEFDTIVSRMSGYWAEEYYPSVSDNFSTDKSTLKRGICDATAKVDEHTYELWNKQLQQRVAELEAQAASAQGTRVILDQVAEQQRAEQKQLLAQRSQVQGEMGKTIECLDKDAGAGRRFVTMLYEEYLAELQQRRALIANAKSPVEALFALVSVRRLVEECRKIKPSDCENL